MRSSKISRSLTAAGMFMLCWMAFLPTALEAQGRGRPGRMPGPGKMNERMEEAQKKQAEKQFERLCEHLQLDKKQKKKARRLFDDMQKKTEKVARDHRRGKLNQTEAGEKRIKISLDYREKFRALLSEQQNERYEKLRVSGLKPGYEKEK